MKRILASVGMAAIGAATVQGQLGSDVSKPWSVSASLRGFYDDNVNTSPSGSELDSYGVEVSPTLSFALPLGKTDISAAYTFGYKWYEKDINGSGDHDDQTHTFAAQLRHAFSERLLMSVQDSFVVGQEPDAIRIGNGGADATFQRIPGNNIRNYGSIIFNAQVTRPFGIEVGYANALYDYEDDNYAITSTPLGNPTTVSASKSGLLDRMEHTAHIDGRWQVQRDTVGILGYQFNATYYTHSQPIGVIVNTPPTANDIVTSSDRDSYSHYGYVGMEHNFRPELFGSVRLGVRYTDNYNSPNNETYVSPYVRNNLRWTYAQESYLDVGVSHDRSATDQFSVQGDSITVDSDTTVAYLSLNHRIVADLFGSVVGQFQYSTLEGGLYDNEHDRYYLVGANLEYRINRHVSANVGYNFDKLDSDVSEEDRDFERNRVYIGATFLY